MPDKTGTNTLDYFDSPSVMNTEKTISNLVKQLSVRPEPAILLRLSPFGPVPGLMPGKQGQTL
jgi:hypothetical protein